MGSFKEKSQGFAIGLMAGLIIAGSFFILKLDDYFKELNFYKNIAKTLHVDANHDEATIKPDDKAPVKEKKSKDYASKNKFNLTNDSSTIKKTNSDFVLDADTLNRTLTKDSIEKNSTATSLSEDIVVRKDELLSTKTIEVINLNLIVNRMNAKDSLLQKVSGVKDDRNNAKQLINIELWQSPLNYKGYKMSKYKVALYGIATFEGLKMYTIDDMIYMKNGSSVYKLENSNEYRPYDHITDETIISKLK